MLGIMRRGRVDDIRLLAADEDRALRRAFGRYGVQAARDAGARVVREHQGGFSGQWFACSCRGGALPPPVLVPVSETHIRRHVEGAWPEHAEWCDWFREPKAQRAVSASFRRPSREGSLGLVRAFASSEPLERTLSGASNQHRRGRLARLLFSLLDDAGLTQAKPGGSRAIAQQFAAFRDVAGSRELDAGIALSRFLCTYPPALAEFTERIAKEPAERFRHSGRPHGVLVGIAVDAGKGRIVPAHGDPFEVAGEISIFAERHGHDAGRRMTPGARAPYVMACTVGRRHPDGPVQVLRAYLHPCMARSWLLPVDSNNERVTLRQLLSIGHKLRVGRQILLTIDKPVFDLSPPDPSGQRGEAADPHEPVLPDFIVRAEGGRTAVVETMGYDLPAYRARKAEMHVRMSEVCGGAAVIEHDFCQPPAAPQDDRDRRFRRACGATLLRPRSEHNPSGAHIAVRAAQDHCTDRSAAGS